MQYERAVLAGLRSARSCASPSRTRCRAYDVARHQQAAMPEQLLAPEPAHPDPERDDQEQEPGRQEALDLTALRGPAGVPS
ncbi:hypothetical protein ABZ923_31285 [Streptomyces sp. NPDC046881]|uniref:hypothetical protein n=1 Tax=Streptomyces sp. NPDC046881 TaxID=3155374 RepID=UPI0033E29C47